MIQNTVVFIVNGDGSFFKQPPNTKFTANSVNKNSIFVIAPFVNTASIIANFKVAHKTQQVSRVATLTTMKPNEITNESYVFDWNVWEVKVPQPTLQFLANNRGSEILVSFNVGETTPSRVPTKFDTILGEITDTEFILPSITEDGRYIVKVASYEYESGKYAFFNDTIIADNIEQEYKIFRAKYSAGLTPSVAFKVDPSIPMANFDEYEPTTVEQLIIQVNYNTGEIVNLNTAVGALQDRATQSESDIDLIEADVLELQGKVEVAEDRLDDIEDGTIVVKKAEQDEDGNNIKDTYSTVVINNKHFKDVTYNNVNGILTFTYQDNTTKEIDLPLEFLVESGYYDDVTNELVLVLANGSEIRIPVGNLLTDLDAHNIRFNGSGTNYLTTKTNVEDAVKELDTQVKATNDSKVNTSDIVNNLNSTDTDKPLSANQGKVLNDITAKLAVSNVFTQPQQVPNATQPQHATNLSQVETMFEMFKRQLRGYNLAMPKLTGKTDLGGGSYRLYNANGITIDYNIYSGIFTINGTLIAPTSYEITNFIEAGTKTLSYVYVDGSFDQSNILFNVAPEFNSIVRVWNYNYTTNAQNTATQTVNTTIYIQFVGIATFDNFQFKLQWEKGTQATPPTVAGQIPQYKIVGEE